MHKYGPTKKDMSIPKQACGLQPFFFVTFCMDHTSKTTQASTLKLARLVLPLLLSWTTPMAEQIFGPVNVKKKCPLSES